VFGLKVGPSGGALQVFVMRGGRVVERVELATEPGALVPREAEVLQAALQQFYEARIAPAEVHLPLDIEDADAVEAWLSERAGRKVRILVPRRGDKRALVELATRNAELSYRTRFNEITAAHFDALETLRATLGLPVIPRRIECFDISTIQGSETVAAMVVCEDGRMKKSEYRKFRMRGMRGMRGIGDRGSGIRQDTDPESRIPDPRSRTPDPGRLCGNARSDSASLSHRDGSRRTVS
jgi:excinuclease ABC subunit C